MQSVVALRPNVTPVSEHQVFEVYRYATDGGGIESVERMAADLRMPFLEAMAVVDQLRENRLLRNHGEDDALELVDPEVAAAALISPMEREIYQRRESIAQIRERIDVFRSDYRSAARPTVPVRVDQVAGELEVRGYLKVAADACQQEALILQSCGFDGEDLDDVLRICATLVARGVQVRIACLHRNRADLSRRMRLKGLMEAGAQVRTVTHLPRAAVVFDRSTAVLLSCTDKPAVASRIQDGEVVQFLLDMFDHIWDGASPLDGFGTGYADVADDLVQTIAGLMAKGFTDEAIARKLGMSVRTARRHIATLMQDLDAVSRFQAGVQAARQTLV